MRNFLFFVLLVFCSYNLIAQDSSAQETPNENTTKKKKWTIGALPAIAYDEDIGFRYGALADIYYYGDWKIYPDYYHNIYVEWSRTTKGFEVFTVTYDSKYLIPKTRFSFETAYTTEKSLDFYGFNGYESNFNVDYEDWHNEPEDFKSRAFYRQQRKVLLFRADLQGKLFLPNTYWLTGLANYNFKMDSVDIDKLNKGASEADAKYIHVADDNLFEQYLKHDLITEDQINGGNHTLLKAGIVYDTRDNEAKPTKGLWSEIMLVVNPGITGSSDYTFGKLSLTHRQYFSIVKNKLEFAYRLAYQDKLWGTIPYYFLPYVFGGGNTQTKDGLGGAKNLRGIRRNRIVGDDYFYGNTELRWIFIRREYKGRNFYFALSGFSDFGMVTGKYEFNKAGITDDIQYLFPDTDEKLHQSLGVGVHFALNENFVIAVDYGRALDKRDGTDGLYVVLDWLF